MLTSGQSIVEFDRGCAIVDRLTQTRHRHYLNYAQRMLSIYRRGIGHERRWLHRRVQGLFADEPDCPTRRIEAFCKLLDDRSTFQEDIHGKASHIRMAVFTKAAGCHPLVQVPDRLFGNSEARTKAWIADGLGMTWAQVEQCLYADVIPYQTLDRFDGYVSAQALLSRYNVAQLQACLYRAEHLIITAARDFKTIVRYAKLAKLLTEIVRMEETTYRIRLTGPASVLDRTRRYGVNFAQFLPSLLACRDWHMIAQIQTPWKGHARLSLTDKDGFHSHLPPPEEFDSSIEAGLADKFGTVRNGWHMIREGMILYDRQKTFVPDFVFRHDDSTEVLLEIVGFWTPEYLARRRATLQAFGNRHHILIAVPQASLREGAVLTDRVIVYKTAIRLAPLLTALEACRAKSGVTGSVRR